MNSGIPRSLTIMHASIVVRAITHCPLGQNSGGKRSSSRNNEYLVMLLTFVFNFTSVLSTVSLNFGLTKLSLQIIFHYRSLKVCVYYSKYTHHLSTLNYHGSKAYLLSEYYRYGSRFFVSLVELPAYRQPSYAESKVEGLCLNWLRVLSQCLPYAYYL